MYFVLGQNYIRVHTINVKMFNQGQTKANLKIQL